MGNTESNVTSGVKKQAGASTQAIYKLVDLKGGGLLVELMKRATKTKQYAELDHAIKTKVEPFLYNKGKGRLIPISQLVLLRNKERPRHKLLPPLRAMEDPNDFDINKIPDVCPVINVLNISDPSKCRDVCWDLNERGAVGETILHLCLLNATALHADLAKRLLRFYPKLINDIYMCDEYYGENVLHLAIVNEDPAMVKYLLNCGANFQERCCGTFMTPEDQKASRTDSIEHEWVCLCPDTNYDGYVYWGEYPLSFAACLGQEECYRLMLARGADPDAQDTNGNTALHMLVIYEKINTFDMAYEIGASLGIRNVLGLTPLTLAAKLARIEIFFHILNIEREIYWQIGSITCAAYPLSQIDTIDIETGRINKNSALNLVVFGDKDEHLELMDGVLVDLLNAKWNAFVKSRFYQKFFLFLVYFLISLVCFTNRPGPAIPEVQKATPSSKVDSTSNSTSKEKKLVDDDWWGADEVGECRLLKVNSLKSQTRLVAEAVMEVGAVFYILEALREAHFLGLSMFIENLMTAPSRVMFLFSCLMMLIMPSLRFFCLDEAEDIMSVIIMLTTAPYFLFFCRGFKTVGPFVVMIYRMVMGDLLRFVSIYLMFVMGFSQAYYIIFLSYDNPNTPEGIDDSSSNPMPSPMESVMAMFLMSLTNFGDYYGAFEKTDHPFEAKLLFVVYMAIVAILLVNMLIAMMGNTYQKIAETRNEWQRQWARIVLVVERGVSPTERLRKLLAYSQPMADGRRALVLRLNQTEEDKEEMKEILEMKRVHDRIVKRRKRGAKPLASPSGTASGSALPSPCPKKRLQGDAILQPNSNENTTSQRINNQNLVQRY
ncbi:transient receptor potential cation channel subfamily V member 5 [Hetaerina americana]|uniref:transient receptor potential cation channel subfamily V member 5 n=1 Tax=Hetaerina americana TaxID=62018 RepID=UPI003A7F3486